MWSPTFTLDWHLKTHFFQVWEKFKPWQIGKGQLFIPTTIFAGRKIYRKMWNQWLWLSELSPPPVLSPDAASCDGWQWLCLKSVAEQSIISIYHGTVLLMNCKYKCISLFPVDDVNYAVFATSAIRLMTSLQMLAPDCYVLPTHALLGVFYQ